MTLVKTTKQSDEIWRNYYADKKKNVEWLDNNKKDLSLQGFFKRLRYYEEEKRKRGYISLTQFKRGAKTGKYFSEQPIKYYGVGEYGSKKFRSHYHIIVFNVSDIESIRDAWTFGECHIDEVNKNTIEYTLKYINKDPEIKRKGFDGIKEFSLMSKGLGKSYITQDAKRFYSEEYNNYIQDSKGIKVSLPRYYSNKMVSKSDRERKAKYNANEARIREMEDRRIAVKYQRNYDQDKIGIAMANKHKLKTPLKIRGND